jgi:nucleoside-diphosphate-sugar epimerase
LQSFEVEYCVGELYDTESIRKAAEGCDTIFHVAGLVRARNYQRYENVNRLGTEQIARVASYCSTPPVFVYVSSLAAAGHSPPEQPRRETDPAEPISKYGKSKWAGENSLLSFSEQMPCTIVRPGIVFGEADRMNLELFKAIKKFGICPLPGFGDKFYSWIHAADLSDLLIIAAQKGERLNPKQPMGTGIYFESNDGGRRLSEIGHLIGLSVGRNRVWSHSFPIALWTVSTYYEAKKWLTGEAQPLDWEKMWDSLHHWTCSPEKAKTQFQFSPLPLEERINQTSRWYEENGWLA